jgi:hypothetical protein
MKLVRSDTPEVVRCIASGGARASRHFPAFVYGCSLNVLILLIAIAVSLIVSVRAAAWFGVSAFLAWNMYVLWLLKFSSRTWVIAACTDRVCIRPGVNNPNVIMLEVSEIASMSIRTAEVFLYGPKPKFIDWLVIEPVQAQMEDVPDHIASFLGDIPSIDPSNPVNVANEGGRLIIGWKWCQPALGVFLQQLARECPSIVIAPEERSELDLNGVWHGPRGGPDAQQRRMLVQAKRLGFGCECERLLSLYRGIPRREVSAYMAEIEQEEAAGCPALDPPLK